MTSKARKPAGPPPKEVVDWINQRVREIRASPDHEGLAETFWIEAPRRFPHYRKTAALFALTFCSEFPLEYRPPEEGQAQE